MLKNVIIYSIGVNPASGYINDFKSDISAVTNWYPPIITGFLSLLSVAAILSFLLKKL